jgi:iron complex transport system substrate-binding protein
MKKGTRILALLLALMLTMSLTACGSKGINNSKAETRKFTDSAGREVELPKEITRIAPSGAVATMILATLCPEYLVSVSSTPDSAQLKYLPQNLAKLPATGQLYSSKGTINKEAIINVEPQVIIDLGDKKNSIKDDMDALQNQVGIPTIFIEAGLGSIANAYRTMGELLNLKERAEKIAALLEETLAMAAENSAKIPAEDRISVMFTTGTTGLDTNAKGSYHAQVLDLVGADNAVVVEDVSSKGGGNQIDMEQLYNFDPEVILFPVGSIYNDVSGMKAWSELTAIKNGTYYEIPCLPYNWMADPPSINMILGVWWLGNLLYPEIYDYDMAEKTREIYELFWDYKLTDDEVRELLKNSTLKNSD